MLISITSSEPGFPWDPLHKMILSLLARFGGLFCALDVLSREPILFYKPKRKSSAKPGPKSLLPLPAFHIPWAL